MIARHDIVSWGIDHPWADMDQIEQDLLLSQAICEISNDSLLGSEIALRGGTALHKLFIEKPYRYSEDLDYVRTTKGGIGTIMRRLTDIGKELGYDVRTKMGMYPKVYWRFISESGSPGKIKIEINTYEGEPVLGFSFIEHKVNSQYYVGTAKVRTFRIEELIATKMRALYQRSKGRDLYDLWLALSEMGIDTDLVIKTFDAYRPEGLTRDELVSNVEKKLQNQQFLTDTLRLIRNDASKFDPVAAGNIIIDKLLSRV